MSDSRIEKHHRVIADRIVKAELASYFVSPRPGAPKFDIYEAIAQALADAEDFGYGMGYDDAEEDYEDELDGL